jgi:hypothetical protein
MTQRGLHWSVAPRSARLVAVFVGRAWAEREDGPIGWLRPT